MVNNRMDVYRGRSAVPRTIDEWFDDMQRSFEDWMRPFFGGLALPTTELFGKEGQRIPYADIAETENEYTVTAELPGIPKENIEVKVTDGNTVEITGHKTEEKKESHGQFIRQERSSSDFYRSFVLSEDIDTEKVEAKVENGVLTLRLPKKTPEGKRVKKVEIK